MPTASPKAPAPSMSAKNPEQPGQQRMFRIEHPIPPEPTEQQLALWRDLDVYEDLDTAIRDAKAVTHALYCMQRCHSEFNEGEASELMQLSYLGMKVCDNAMSLAKELRKVALKWGETSEEFRKLADVFIADFNSRNGWGPDGSKTKRAKRALHTKQTSPSNSRKNGHSRGSVSDKGERLD